MDIGLVHRTAGGISCEFISGLFLPEQPSSKRPAAAPPPETSLIENFMERFMTLNTITFVDMAKKIRLEFHGM